MEEKKEFDLSTLSGLEVSLGDFKAKVVAGLNVEVSDTTGWMVRYPAYTPSWYVLLEWMTTWNSSTSRKSMEIFVKDVLYLHTMRLYQYDVELLRDFLDMHNALTERIAAAEETEKDDGE